MQLWDSRQKDPVQTYDHHFDYISDFLWLEDKKQLVATRYVFNQDAVEMIFHRHLEIFGCPLIYCFWNVSADGTLSVMDVRSKKPKPIARSEDQEDELLSIATIKG